MLLNRGRCCCHDVKGMCAAVGSRYVRRAATVQQRSLRARSWSGCRCVTRSGFSFSCAFQQETLSETSVTNTRKTFGNILTFSLGNNPNNSGLTTYTRTYPVQYILN